MEVHVAMKDVWNAEALENVFDSLWYRRDEADRYVAEQNRNRTGDYSPRYFVEDEAAVVRGSSDSLVAHLDAFSDEHHVPASSATCAFAEIERLRLATDEGTLAKRADRIWEIACEMQGRPVPGALRFVSGGSPDDALGGRRSQSDGFQPPVSHARADDELARLKSQIDTADREYIALAARFAEASEKIASLEAWQRGALSCREAEEARIEEYRLAAERASQSPQTKLLVWIASHLDKTPTLPVAVSDMTENEHAIFASLARHHGFLQFLQSTLSGDRHLPPAAIEDAT